jgi:hypothetical protein
VASGAAGTFVATGPGYTAAGQSVVFVSEQGGERVVVSGFNSVADCAYDREADVLYVTDNAFELEGAATGDTVFAIASASTAVGLSAVGNELLAAGSIASAASVAIDGQGAVYVGDAVGGGAGSVVLVSGTGSSDFIGDAFEYTGGLAFDADGNLLVAETTASWTVQISRFDGAGSLLGVVSGPGYGHGSYDLAFDVDGNLLVTGAWGGDVVAIGSDGSASTFVSGLTYATGVDVDPFTGRVTLLSSTFSGVEEDNSLFRFTPVSRLVPGRGSKRTACVHEFYGVELVARKPGRKARHAICVDGAACDADGSADGVCTFPLGMCLNLDDERFADCDSPGVAAFEVKAKPSSAILASLASSIAVALPRSDSTCQVSDGVTVPLRVRPKGLKPGKAKVKVKATLLGSKRKDRDALKLLCKPGA